jgi:hypothetical protein
MEIVTHPMSLDYHKKFCWVARYGYENTTKAIMDKAKKVNFGRYATASVLMKRFSARSFAEMAGKHYITS